MASLDALNEARLAAAAATKPTSTAQIGKYIGADGKYYNSPVEAALGRDIGSSVNYAANVDTQVAAAQASAPKPLMSKEQIAGGGQVKWVGSVDGKWEIIMPIGSTLIGSKGAGFETSSTSASSTTKTAEQTDAYNNAKALAQSFVDAYGGQLSDYFDTVTGKVTSPSKDVIAKKLNNPSSPTEKTELSRVTNPDGSITITYSDKTTVVIPKPNNGSGSPVPLGTGNAASPVASLAIDTFKGTLALFFGQGEMSQPWVNELYNLVNPLYKTGSSVDEAFNLALQQGRNNPNLKAFTDRFQGIYALQDKLVAGQAVLVPTIAQYTAAEAGMGNVLRQAGLGSIATQQYLGTVIGKGLSVTDVGNYVNNIYNEIQNLPQDIKDSVMQHYPGLDNVSLAKAILTGDKGFTQLQKELTAQEIQGVAAKQGLGTYNPVTGKYSGISDAQSMDLAGQGFNMATAQPGLTKAALAAPTVDLLSNITAGATPMTQADIVNATVGGLASQQRKLDLLAQQEVNRFQGGSGNAPGAFSTGYLRRTSAAGLI